MKRTTTSIIMSALLACALTACGGQSRSASPTDSTTQESAASSTAQESTTTQTPTASESTTATEATAPAASATDSAANKVLVAFFSRVGNTDGNFPEGVDVVSSASLLQADGKTYGNAELMASWIAEASSGDLFAIQTGPTYPADYDATVDQAKKEQADGTRPALTAHVQNMADYSTVILVYPNWWGDLPMAVYSFLDEYDLSGKQVVAYATHEGSGFSGTVQAIQSAEPQATVREGLAVRGADVANAKSDLQDNVRSLGIGA